MAAIDTHCHLDLLKEKGIPPREALQEAKRANIEAVLQVATGIQSALFNKKWADQLQREKNGELPSFYWSAALHPGEALSWRSLESLEQLFALIRASRSLESFWGIGETGLDYFYANSSQDREEAFCSQKESLRRHLALAGELSLPLIFHLRDTHQYDPDRTDCVKDALALVKEYWPLKGVLHCFTYTDREALPFVELGWFVSYSGLITFKKAADIRTGAVNLPLHSLLVETDAPFLAPQPHRGKINQPSYVGHTLDFLAELRAEKCGEDPREVKNIILENSKRFLDLKNSKV